ncbi:MAG: DUF2892 domain-containing protein [Gammaproteobacteria bacterium]
MTERWYRAIQGVYLLVALYLENDAMMYGFLGVLAFEVITNFRVPHVVTRLRYGAGSVDFGRGIAHCALQIDSERMLRVVVVFLLMVGYVLFPGPVWFFPWFVAAMLLLAGITNICPMVMMFQFLGLK